MTTLLGTSGNDALSGSTDVDSIADGAGDDYVASGAGNDSLTGGAGNDWFEPGAGTDTLTLSAGFGRDILDVFTGSGGPPYPDNLVFTDIASDDQLAYRTGEQLGVTFAGTADSLTVLDFFSVTPAPFGSVTSPIAAGGTDVTTPTTDSDDDGIPDVQELPLFTYGTGNGDTIQPASVGSFENWVWGGLGNDFLTATGNFAMLFGGGGNDTLTAASTTSGAYLVGGRGDDTYVVGAGVTAFIDETGSSGGDTLVATSLGFNDPDTFALTIDGRHLMVFSATAGTTIFIIDWQKAANQIENVQLSDGTYSYAFIAANIFSAKNFLGNFTWESATSDTFATADFDHAIAQIQRAAGDDQGPTLNLTIGGTAASETLTGFAGNNTLVGDTGDDTLIGNGGSDIYVFRPGDGNDTIDNVTNSTGGYTVLRFGAGVLARNLSFSQSGLDLLLGYGPSDSVRLTGWFGSNASARSNVQIGTSDLPVMSLLDASEAGTADSEFIVGTNGFDAMTGGGGDDRLQGGGGPDTISGGTGVDTAAYRGPRTSYLISYSGASVVVTDVDGAANGGNDVTDTLTGIERLSFSDATIPVNQQSSDLSGDGRADYLWQNSGGVLSQWNVSGSAITFPPFLPAPSSDWVLQTTADFNADGRAGYLWQNTGSLDPSLKGVLAEWYVDSNSLIDYQPFLPAPSSDWNLIATADFNADGRADFLWQNTGSLDPSLKGDLAEWYVDSNALISASPYLPGPSPDWTFLGNGDFNGDGRADFLWQNSSLGVLAEWNVDGSYNITGSPYIVAPSSDWTFKSIADLNGDGKSDLLWQNSVSGTLAPWYMDGGAVANYGTQLAGPSSDWQLKGVADFDGDGRADYLWQNATTGALSTWQVDPTTSAITTTTLLPAPSSDWTLKSTLFAGQAFS